MENQSFEFILSARTKIGEGTALNLSGYLKELLLERVGIIIDKNVRALPYVEKILTSIKGLSLVVWEYDIKGEPDYDSLDRVKLLFLNKKNEPLVDSFIALGGGSVIDFAKGLATLMTNPGEARAYRGFPIGLNPSLPIIALPTVAGSGSEVTYNASFIDWKERRKMGINTFNNFPKLSILDPLLTLDCPKQVSISSAMDSMVHALESYATPKANALSRLFSERAFLYVYHALPKVEKNLRDTNARLDLQLGAYLAGIAIVQAGGGIASILSYTLGVHGKIPHGLAGAVFIPYIVEHNAKKGFDYSSLYDSLEKRTAKLSRKQKSLAFAKKLFALYNTMKIPTLFSKFALNEEQKNTILSEIKTLGNGFKITNPVPFSPDDAKKITLKIFNA